MKARLFQFFTILIAVSMLLAACAPQAGTDVPAATEVSVDGTGPKTVTGTVTYTNTFFTMGVAEPVIILEDQGGFVTRDRKFLIPVESQVIGQVTSDFYTSPFTYSLTLPEEPKGTLHDVDHDGADEPGVMVFAVAYWTNTWGDPFLERRDQGGGGWSSAYASTKVSDDSDFYLEVFGGKYLKNYSLMMTRSWISLWVGLSSIWIRLPLALNALKALRSLCLSQKVLLRMIFLRFPILRRLMQCLRSLRMNMLSQN
jgi:hypothetical protein